MLLKLGEFLSITFWFRPPYYFIIAGLFIKNSEILVKVPARRQEARMGRSLTIKKSDIIKLSFYLEARLFSLKVYSAPRPDQSRI